MFSAGNLMNLCSCLEDRLSCHDVECVHSLPWKSSLTECLEAGPLGVYRGWNTTLNGRLLVGNVGLVPTQGTQASSKKIYKPIWGGFKQVLTALLRLVLKAKTQQALALLALLLSFTAF